MQIMANLDGNQYHELVLHEHQIHLKESLSDSPKVESVLYEEQKEAKGVWDERQDLLLSCS